ncbi:MAG: arsenic transporter [Lachnospiraceae bacterium]|nr:arsenic transporter [Lachnospiraceae bacterium]
MTVALILFALTYIGLLALPDKRHLVALVAAALFVILGILPVGKLVETVDFNVLLMIAGTMGIVSLFIDSQMPMRLADLILKKTPNVKWAVVFLSLFAGIVSAFIDNVATVLMIAPVAMAISRRLKINPVPMIIAIAVSSNLQGAATLVGDTTSILLGGYAGMDFMDFFFFRGRPCMFWAVELGAVLSSLSLLWIFRKETGSVDADSLTPVNDYVPSVLLAGVVVLLIGASFIPGKPAVTNGLICMSLLVAGLIYTAVKTRDGKKVAKPVQEIDFATLFLLLGLFVVIGGIKEAGVIDAVAGIFVGISGDNLFLAYTLIVWASVAFSAFIDNIPYVATMLPVVQGMASMMGVEPYVLYFGLLTGATLGGNLTPVGASANITAIGILRKAGFEVKNRDFLRIGIPFTLTAVIAGYVFVWVFWGIG